MRSRLLIQVLLAAGILLLWFYISKNPGQIIPQPGPFDSIEANSVQSLVWIGGDGIRFIERSGKKWDYRCGSTSRPDYTKDYANERYVGQALQELNRFKAQRMIKPDEEGALFGLNPPQAGLVIQTKTHAETLWVGNRTPVAGGRYAYWSALGHEAAVLDAYIIEQYVMAGDDRLREPRLGRIPLGRIDEAEVLRDGHSFRLVFREENWWVDRTAEEGGPVRADSMLCAKAVGTFMRMRAIHFLHAPDDPDLNELDLDPPIARWILRAGARIDTFRIGRHFGQEGHLIVWANQRPPARLQDDGWALFASPMETFRYRSLFATDETFWEKIEILAPNGSPIDLRRETDGWTLERGTADFPGPDPERILSTEIANLSRLRIASFDDRRSKDPAGLTLIITRFDGLKDSLLIWIPNNQNQKAAAHLESSHQQGVLGSVPSTEINYWLGLAGLKK